MQKLNAVGSGVQRCWYWAPPKIAHSGSCRCFTADCAQAALCASWPPCSLKVAVQIHMRHVRTSSLSCWEGPSSEDSSSLLLSAGPARPLQQAARLRWCLTW